MRRIKHLMGFPQMARLLPESPRPEGDGCWIAHTEIGEEMVKWTWMREAITGGRDGLEPGTYVVLNERKGLHVTTWMSDTWLERDSNREILRDARGDVLMVGLGIGMVAVAVCQKAEVTSVTVLEINPDVIRLVAPHIKHDKLRVVQADAFRPPVRGRRFDTIYLDVWADICTDNWGEIKALCQQYRPFARQGGKVTAWQKDHIQYLVRSGRWR